jgi:hypothetical protein
MATHLLLYSVDDLVMGSVDCEGSIWTLSNGKLSNKYAIRLKLEHTGIVARFSLGPWHSPNLNIVGTKQAAGDTVIIRPGMICVDVKTPPVPSIPYRSV